MIYLCNKTWQKDKFHGFHCNHWYCVIPLEQLPCLIALLTRAWPLLIALNCLPINGNNGPYQLPYFIFLPQINVTINYFKKRYPGMIPNMLILSLFIPWSMVASCLYSLGCFKVIFINLCQWADAQEQSCLKWWNIVCMYVSVYMFMCLSKYYVFLWELFKCKDFSLQNT